MTSLPRTNRVVCDYLDVTYSLADAPYPAINRLLLDAGFFVESYDRVKFTYTHPAELAGTLIVGPSHGRMRISASGAMCRLLRTLGVWQDYLFELGQSPHNVTRLDAALDLAMDGADLVAAMRKRHSSGKVNLRRKSVATSTLLAVRDDGRETGTWYAGYRSKARLTARVYDKAWEALCQRGERIPPTARVEVTARSADVGVTLRDAMLPDALFWHIAAPAILTAPEDAPMFVPNTEPACTTAPPRDFDPAALLRRRVESFAMLDALGLVADELGPNGRKYLLTLLQKRLEAPAGTQASAEDAA